MGRIEWARSSSRKRGPSRRVIALGVVALVLLILWRSGKTTNPPEALRRAREMVIGGELEEARPLLAIAGEEPALHHWATLWQAKLEEKAGKFEEAVALYEATDPTVPAVLDARVALIRLAEHRVPRPGAPSLDVNIGALEQDLQRAERKDLLEEFRYLQAREAERDKQLELAYSLYRRVREQFPGGEFATPAREACKRLLEENPTLGGGDSVAALTADAELLLSENQPDEALAQIERAKAKTAAGSDANLEISLVQERVLRKLKRHKEADDLLLMISADGPAGIADEALLRTARNAWNVNDHYRALEMLDRLQVRFPNSKNTRESQYVEARILEEMNLQVEARDIYQTLGKQQASPLEALRALRRLAWLYYRSENIERAHEIFQTALNKASGIIVDGLTPADRQTLSDHLYHSAYWYLETHLRLKREPDQTFETAKALLSSARNYYGMKAAELLAQAPKPVVVAGECNAAAPDDFIAALKSLNDVGLTDLAEFEIDWKFAAQSADIANQTLRAQLSTTYGQIPSGIKLAQKTLEQTPDPASPCRAKLIEISFPRPFAAQFQKAADAEKIPLPLLYALARTESYFDPKAVSRSDARGLVQLMASTAEHEGLSKNEDLFDPEVNLRLAAKHIKRLLNSYAGEQAYSIAAYNAGGAAVNRWRTRYENLSPAAWIEMIGYPETMDYVRRVLYAESVYQK